MEDQQKVKDEIRALEVELSKHRKLLHRAVGNRILPHINYHHYEIVRLIGEINTKEAEYKTKYVYGFPLIGVPDSHGDVITGKELLEKLKDSWNRQAHDCSPITPANNLVSIRMAYDEKMLAEITPDQMNALNELGKAGAEVGERMRELFLKYEDEAILNGQFSIERQPDGTVNDYHMPAHKPKNKKNGKP